MYNPFSLDGKTVLVTGASSGIGRTVAIECSRLGAKVVISARNEEQLIKTLSLLEGTCHQYICAELTDENAIKNLVENVPVLDGVVCNAGINKLAPVTHIKQSDLEDILNVNAVAPAMIVKMLLKKKKFNKGASVVFTSSVSGNYTSAIAHSSYSMSKAALSSFMRIAALELSSKHIRCNAVCPGAIDTPVLHGGLLVRSR